MISCWYEVHARTQLPQRGPGARRHGGRRSATQRQRRGAGPAHGFTASSKKSCCCVRRNRIESTGQKGGQAEHMEEPQSGSDKRRREERGEVARAARPVRCSEGRRDARQKKRGTDSGESNRPASASLVCCAPPMRLRSPFRYANRGAALPGPGQVASRLRASLPHDRCWCLLQRRIK
jgi:hypothetical protein